MVSSTVNGQNVSVGYGYTARLLTAITHNGFDYLFEYDGFERQTKISIGGDMFAKNAYTLTDTTTVTTTYANGDSLTVTTDRHQAPIAKSYTKTERVTYIDNSADVVNNYTYNELGNVVKEPRNGETFKPWNTPATTDLPA